MGWVLCDPRTAQATEWSGTGVLTWKTFFPSEEDAEEAVRTRALTTSETHPHDGTLVLEVQDASRTRRAAERILPDE